jgi:hypothetical protein
MTTMDTQRRVQEMIDQGLSDRDIADRLNTTAMQVRGIRQELTVDPAPGTPPPPAQRAPGASSLSDRVLAMSADGKTIPRIAKDLHVTEQYAREVIRAAQADQRATAPAQRPAAEPPARRQPPVMCLREHLDDHSCPEPELIEVEGPPKVCTLRHTERVRTVVGPCHRPHGPGVCLRRHDPKPLVRIEPDLDRIELAVDVLLDRADQHPDEQVRSYAVGARHALDLMAQRLDEIDAEQAQRERDAQAAALRAQLEEHQREIDRITQELSALHPEEETSARAVEARNRRAAASAPAPTPAGFEVGPGPKAGRQISPEGRERMRLAGIETARKRREAREKEQQDAGTATSGSAAG